MAKRFGEILVGQNYIEAEQYNSLLKAAESGNKYIGTLLIEKGYFSEEALIDFISEFYDLSSKRPKDESSDESFLEILPLELAKEHKLIGLSEYEKIVAPLEEKEDRKDSGPRDNTIPWSQALMSTEELTLTFKCIDTAIGSGKGIVVELGTYQGGTAVNIAHHIADSESDARFICIDKFYNHTYITQFYKFFSREIHNDEVHLLVSDSRLAAKLLDIKVDVLIIDACHCRECAQADFLAWENRIAPGGIVCFHDAGDEAQGLDINANAHQPDGCRVQEALQDLKLWDDKRSGWELFEFENTSRGLACYRKKKGIAKLLGL